MVRKEYDFSQAKRGAVIPSPGKTRITIMLDDDLIEFFRAKGEAQGSGYQTMINSTLRTMVAREQRMSAEDKPLTVASLRKVLREELHQEGNREGNRGQTTVFPSSPSLGHLPG